MCQMTALPFPNIEFNNLIFIARSGINPVIRYHELFIESHPCIMDHDGEAI